MSDQVDWPDPSAVGPDGDWAAHDAAVRRCLEKKVDALLVEASQHLCDGMNCKPEHWVIFHLSKMLAQD